MTLPPAPRERFAPSPTGPLHLGHAFSALTVWGRAEAAGGTALLRIDDIDRSRARPQWEAQIFDDLAWLGLSWPEPVLRQSQRAPAHREAMAKLWRQGLLYPCRCTRRDIAAAREAPQEGGQAPIGGAQIYPGTCRNRPKPREMPRDAALRLDLSRAWESLAGAALGFEETGPAQAGWHALSGEALRVGVGDVVVARQGLGSSYLLSVVLDDAHQGITHVTRGEDLFEATPIQVVMQRLLDLPTPVYHHHRLIRDAAGKRLAKRDDARAIAVFRAQGATPGDIRSMVGLPPLPPAASARVGAP